MNDILFQTKLRKERFCEKKNLKSNGSNIVNSYAVFNLLGIS